MPLTVALPDDVARLLDRNADRQVLEAVLVQLYRGGKLGSGAVGRLLGMTREEAIRWLGQQGAAYFDASPAELDDDVKNARRLGGGA